MMPDNIAKLNKAVQMELNPEARRVPEPVEAELEQRVLKWIKIARERFMTTNIGLSGTMIQHRAVKFASEMGIKFAASNGWLHRFLKRYQLKHINLHGEAGDVDQGKVQEKIAQIREQLKEFDVEFIFNMDETGLFYRYFPRGTYVTSQEDAAGVNKKNRAGLEGHEGQGPVHRGGLLQYNRLADGAAGRHRHGGKSDGFPQANPRGEVAVIWGNCPGHKFINIHPQIVITFLPPLVTSVFQSMDMGSLFTLKCRYKTEVVVKLSDVIEDWDTVLAQGHHPSRGARERPQEEGHVAGKDNGKGGEVGDKGGDKGGDTGERGLIDGICDLVAKLSMPDSVDVTDARKIPGVLTDNLFVEKNSGLADVEVRKATKTWLSLEDDPSVLEDEVALEPGLWSRTWQTWRLMPLLTTKMAGIGQPRVLHLR
ncbi:unnamed protein product [Ectocarpus sp. CCAP 1310/34]|nr:unnamed protein product [Ectocarpus sp. CCAP 1310/34]